MSRAITVCRYLKRALFFSCHYPAFTEHFINKEIVGERKSNDGQSLRTRLEEVEDYRANLVVSSRGGRWRALVMVFIYILYDLKNLLFVYEFFQLFDFDNFRANLREMPAHSSTEIITFSYNSSSLSAGDRQQQQHEKLKLISCLITNCSRLRPAVGQEAAHFVGATTVGFHPPATTAATTMQLLDDFTKLPLFRWCHPWQTIAYPPATLLDAFGILVYLVVIYTTSLLGIMPVVQQMLFPASNDMIMFVTSPQLTAAIARRRAERILRDVRISYQNYSNCYKLPDLLLSEPERLKYEQMVAQTSLLDPTWQSWATLRRPPETTSRHQVDSTTTTTTTGKGRQASRNPTMRPPVDQVQLDERVVDECVPLTRTDWWRTRSARIWTSSLAMSLLAISALTAIIYLYIQYRVVLRRILLKKFDHEMAATNCYLWHESIPLAALSAQNALKITEPEIAYSNYTFVETFLLTVTPTVGIAFLLTYYWALLTEIGVWLAEVRMNLVASLLIARLAKEQPELVDCDQRLNQVYQISSLRGHFKRSTILLRGGVMVIRRMENATLHPDHNAPLSYYHNLMSSKLNDRLLMAQILAQIAAQHRGGSLADAADEDDDDDDSVASNRWPAAAATGASRKYERIETLEQVYVNFRLLVEQVHETGPSMTMVFAIIYLLNYGYVLIAVYCQLKFPAFYLEPLAVLGFNLAIGNFLIYLSADFHANAKKLQPLLWSLVAQLTESSVLREQHMCFLWRKQAMKLDTEGGLALRALGMRITYVYIIELTIWTTTIFALAYKPHGPQ